MDDTSSLVEGYKNKSAEFERLRKSFVEELRPKFKEFFLPFLAKWDQVKFLRWTQYTPYYNDGDPCVFQVHDLYGYTDQDDPDAFDGTVYDWSSPRYLKPQFGDKAEEVLKDFGALTKEFSGVPEDVMQGLFGDHARVTVTREGLDVEEYEHD
jgi:hypothetical protein